MKDLATHVVKRISTSNIKVKTELGILALAMRVVVDEERGGGTTCYFINTGP